MAAIGSVACGDRQQFVSSVAEKITVEVPGVDTGTSGGNSVLRFAFNTCNPRALGLSGDDRELGVRVYWIDWD